MFACVHELVEMAGSYGFAGNLWHNYLTFLLVNNENAFSTACEIVGPVQGSINEFARHDFTIFRELYEFDLNRLDSALGTKACEIIGSYQNINEGNKLFNKRIRDRICSLSERLHNAVDVQEFMDDLVYF